MLDRNISNWTVMICTEIPHLCCHVDWRALTGISTLIDHLHAPYHLFNIYFHFSQHSYLHVHHKQVSIEETGKLIHEKIIFTPLIFTNDKDTTTQSVSMDESESNQCSNSENSGSYIPSSTKGYTSESDEY